MLGASDAGTNWRDLGCAMVGVAAVATLWSGEGVVRTLRLIGSPDYQPSDEELRAKVVASASRSYYPAGFLRHMAAISASGDRGGRRPLHWAELTDACHGSTVRSGRCTGTRQA